MEISKEKLLAVIKHFWDCRNDKTMTPEFLADAIESSSEKKHTIQKQTTDKQTHKPC